MNMCEGCGADAIANIGVPVCVSCSYVAGCKSYAYVNGRLCCYDTSDWHTRGAILDRLKKFRVGNQPQLAGERNAI